MIIAPVESYITVAVQPIPCSTVTHHHIVACTRLSTIAGLAADVIDSICCIVILPRAAVETR